MSQIVKLRRSSVSGQKPTNSNLQLGELALNTTDGKVYMAKSGSLGPSVEELISTNTVNTGSVNISGSINLLGHQTITGSLTVTDGIGYIDTGLIAENSDLLLTSGSNVYVQDGGIVSASALQGDGSGIINIPASGVTGLELYKIVSGSVSASISPDRGLEINTDVTITGSIHTTDNVTASNFTGSFIGDGSKVYNIPLSGVTNLITVSGSIDSRLDALETLSQSFTGSISGSMTGSIYADYIVFNSSSTSPLQDYMLQANTTDKTLDLRMGNNATLQLGQELYYPPIVNKSGASLPNGALVMFNPADPTQGNRISVVKCVSDGTYPADYIVGILTEDVAINAEGFATWFGYVRDVSRTELQNAGLKDSAETWLEGQILYPHPTRPGGLTNVQPIAPNLKSSICVITSINGVNITFLVRPHLRGSLKGLHDVNDNTTNSSYGDLLLKSGSVWKSGKGLNGNYAVTGSLTITQNLTVLGSSSLVYLTSSNLAVSSSFISVNVFEPAERFGGLKVYDSGSSTATASLAWDSLNNHWVYQNASGSSYSGGMLLAGPRNSGSLGDEVGLINGRIAKSVGGDHLDNSIISESGTTITVDGHFNAYSLTGSIDFTYLENLPTLVSGSSQIEITGTTGYSTFSSSIKDSIDIVTGSITDLSSSIATTTNDLDGRIDDLETESGSIRGDFNLFTSSYTTGAFTGSFIGDGSGLTNLSNITGSIGQVAILNSDKTVSGSLLTHVTNDTFGIGTSDYNVDQPERLMVDGDESWNIATFQTTQNDNYAEVNIKNLGSGSNSSADLVIWNDISTETNNFLDLGMNSSNYNTGYLGYENDAYLITTGNDLYVGSLTTGSNGHIHLFGGNHWKSSSISIYNDSTIGINTDKDDNQASTIPSSIDGFAVEISGSVKFRNDILVSGSITSSYGVNTPIITNNGHNWEFLSSGQMRPAGTIMGSSYDSNQVDVQNLGPLLLKGMAYGAQVITSPDNGSTSHTWEFGTDGTLTAPGDVNVNGILTAKELHIDYVTSSVLYQSGSTKFGDTLDDTHNFTGSVNISGSINVNSITGSIDFTNLTNVPTLVSGSSQISYTGITDVPSGIVSGSSQILDGSGIWSGSSQLPSGIVSGSSQVSYNGITDVPSGIVSGSSQVIDLGFLTTSSFETFTSSYTTDSSSFDSRINLTTGSINSLNSFSSSVVLTSETASMTVLTSSYALTASYALNAGGGSGGGTLLGAYETLTQAVAASTWSFNHNIGQRYPIFQVFDNEGNVVIPTQIKTLDDNNAEIIFGSAQTGKVIASLGGGNGTTEGFTNSNLWVVDHNLGTDYPDVTIWDSNRRIIFPDRIESIDTNQIKIYFSVPVSGHVSVSRGGHILNGTASASSSAAPGTISGSLQIANLGYATTGSNTFTSNQTINGSLSLSNSLFKQTTITGSTATVGVTTISTTSYDGAFFDYVLKDGTNYRAGSIMSVWDGTTVKYTETTTNDIGDTSGVVMSVVLYGTTITLTATISSGTWTFKTMTRGM